MRIVQRRERVQIPQSPQCVGVEHDGTVKMLAAMHDPVADRVDRADLAGQVEHPSQGRLVIAKGKLLVDGPSIAVVSPATPTARLPYPFRPAGQQFPVSVSQLDAELDRGTAAVEHQDIHVCHACR